MKSGPNTVQYGSRIIHYTLHHVKRKTMEIAVHPDGTVVVRAPLSADKDSIEKRLRKRARWITKQLNFFDKFNPRTPERRYIGGETHYYLGRQYRLKIIKAKKPDVKLTRGFFRVSVNGKKDTERIRHLMDDWYTEKAIIYFNKRLDELWLRFAKSEYEKPVLRVKRMKRRWGSLTKNSVLLINFDLIKAPKECIDYVILHELCHLRHNNHSADFYKLLDGLLPDWEKRKHKLELVMS